MILFYPDKLKNYARIKLICDRAKIPYTYKMQPGVRVIMRNDYRLRRDTDVLNTKDYYPMINEYCVDMSKTFTEQVFEKVFGYSSLVDPKLPVKMLKKTDKQGTKDAEVITGPTEPEEGYIYQRVIDNKINNHHVDYRVYIIGKEIVWIREKWKKRLIQADILKSRPAMGVLTPAQEAKIIEFCGEFGLDFGELDVLVDYPTKRMYIVDVNDMPGVRRNDSKQPGYREELNLLSDKFKEYYDYCSKIKDCRNSCRMCVC
mgnify:CR=1 FL=1